MTQDITSLIEKLEGAEVGSRELDADVLRATGHGYHMDFGNGWYARPGHNERIYGNGPSQVTTSLDAALALAARLGVLPYQADASITGKWSWMVVDEARLGDLEANPYARATAATPALALCAAILRAQSEAR